MAKDYDHEVVRPFETHPKIIPEIEIKIEFCGQGIQL